MVEEKHDLFFQIYVFVEILLRFWDQGTRVFKIVDIIAVAIFLKDC